MQCHKNPNVAYKQGQQSRTEKFAFGLVFQFCFIFGPFEICRIKIDRIYKHTHTRNRKVIEIEKKLKTNTETEYFWRKKSVTSKQAEEAAETAMDTSMPHTW